MILLISLLILETCLLVGLSIYCYRMKEIKYIKLSKLSNRYGKHGMVRLSDPTNHFLDSPMSFVEFKQVGESIDAHRGNGYLNIVVLNVSPCDLDKPVSRKGVNLLYKIQWIDKANNIYWFTDNDTRKRDEIIKEILNDD